MKADGSDVRRLTNNPALDALPAYSPDGKRIVFVSDRLQKDSRRLFTMSSTGQADARRGRRGPELRWCRIGSPCAWAYVRRHLFPQGHRCRRAGLPTRSTPSTTIGCLVVEDGAGITYRINLSPRKGVRRSASTHPQPDRSAPADVLSSASAAATSR